MRAQLVRHKVLRGKFIPPEESISPSKDQRGFFTILGLLVLFVLSLLVAITAYTLQITYSKSHFRKVCFQDTYLYQQEVIRSIDRVILYNKPIFENRKQIAFVETQLKIALASKNAPAVAALKIQLNILRLIQLQLGRVQRMTKNYLEAQLQLRLNSIRGTNSIDLNELSQSWSFFTRTSEEISIQRTQSGLPILADLPHSPAPIYRIAPDVEHRSQVVTTWTSHIFARIHLNRNRLAANEQESAKLTKSIDPHESWKFTCIAKLKNPNQDSGFSLNSVQAEKLLIQIKAGKL